MNMKRHFKYVLTAVFAVTLSGCGFLNQEPYDEFTDAEFWQSEDQVRSFMYGFYTSVFSGYGTGVSHGPFLMGQTLNDDFSSDVSQNNLQPEVIPVSDGAWSFTNVRRANYVLDNIDRLNASKEVLNHWRGVARFFRACYYSNLVFTFGDVPWFDRVPSSTDSDYLYKDRDPRTVVDTCIMADFRYAMDNVRTSDGSLQVNKYVVAGMASRMMLREGTYLKYHYGSDADCMKMAEECLKFSKDAALMVIKSGSYSIAPSYKGLFTSDDLAGNPEVLMYRHYVDGVLAHSTLAYSFTEAQAGASKSFAETFLNSDGTVFAGVKKTAAEFFANRDPRLGMCLRTLNDRYLVKGETNTPFSYALSGYSISKFMDDGKAAAGDPTFASQKNVTDAPCLRYAEVLLNYVEAAYELNVINSSYTFGQDDIDMSVNVLRDRQDVQMPHLVIGSEPADAKRDAIEAVADGGVTPALLWEIRRERRVELCFEGFRLNDLKRWKKLDYVWNDCNPDIRYGAYIKSADYPSKAPEVVYEESGATEGYILRNTDKARVRPVERNYISPVPSGQVQLYEAHGYKLTQTKEWQ